MMPRMINPDISPGRSKFHSFLFSINPPAIFPVFALINFANFKLHKETASNRWISGFAALLCVAAVLALVGYNAQHASQSLMSSLIVVVIVGLVDVFYRRPRDRDRPLSSSMNKRRERVETTHDKPSVIYDKKEACDRGSNCNSPSYSKMLRHSSSTRRPITNLACITGRTCRLVNDELCPKRLGEFSACYP